MKETIELSVIVPCYNEEFNIPEFADRTLNVFSKKGIKGEIVFVNDGSTDGTQNVIETLKQNHENIVGVEHKKNKGIGEGWKSGFKAAKGEFVCVTDVDLQYLPEDIYRLYREIKYRNVDIVQGWRSHIGRLKDSRFMLSRALNIALNLLFGMHLKDNKSGFVVCRKNVMGEILEQRFKYYYPHTFITIAAKAKGFSIAEIETLFESRRVGKSFIKKFPLKLIFDVVVDLVKSFFEYRLLGKKDLVLEKFLEKNHPKKEDKKLSFWRRCLFRLFILTMPIHHWMISHNAGKYYRELKKSQWLSPEKMKELQTIKLKRVVEHAYYHVPYYREKMDKAGLKPSDIQTIGDLEKFPILTKKDIKNNLYFDMLSSNHNKKEILRISTSGSTGEPLVCFADKHQLEIRWAATLRSMEWTGYQFGDKQVRLWHQTIGMTLSQIIRERIDAVFNRRKFIPAFEMRKDNLKKTLKKIVKHRPEFIDGYAESFDLMAAFIKENKLSEYISKKKLQKFNPKGIISSAQSLPEHSRERIEKEFRCKVFDKYGSREFSGIAYECNAHQGHHVSAESYIVELLKDGKPVKPGELGEVFVTDLNNMCVPFIRYKLGDLAFQLDNSPCPCGRGLPRIGQIEGRLQSIIIGTNNQYVPGSFFLHFMKDYDYAIKKMQIVQDNFGEIEFKIIKAKRFTKDALNEILKMLRDQLGQDMKIKVNYVDDIPMVRTGKHRPSLSNLKIDFQKKGV